MATGYTAPIKEGSVTTVGEYLNTVASAFIIDMRESKIGSPIPDMPPMSPRYEEAVEEARAKVAALAIISDEEIAEGVGAYNAALIRSQDESIIWRRENNAPFLEMQAKVMTWDAPEPLANVKEFMLQQLDTSMYPMLKRDSVPLPFLGAEDWLSQERATAQSRLNSAIDELAEQIDRYQRGVAFTLALRGEIERLRAQEGAGA